MTQDHRNSLRILQTQSKKPSSNRLLYILLGFILGILCAGIVVFIYHAFSKTADNTPLNPIASNAQDHTSQSTQAHQPVAATQNDDHDEQSYTPIKDNELSGLFKHDKIQLNTPNSQSNSPFENAFGNKSKTDDPQKATKIVKPIGTVTSKTQIKEIPPKTVSPKLTQPETLSKEPETEIPPASLKISVTRTETEN